MSGKAEQSRTMPGKVEESQKRTSFDCLGRIMSGAPPPGEFHIKSHKRF